MISLKDSRFLVSCENYEAKLFIKNGKEYKEVTNELSEDDKTELIDDLIYAITDLMKNIDKENEQTKDILDDDIESCCRCNSKQTNADRIRNMSDEELASWYVIKCEIMMGIKCQKPYKTCKDCILEWLQSEAEYK